jgi:hypothetical protein
MQKTEFYEMIFLKPSAGHTLKNQVKNENILDKLRIFNLTRKMKDHIKNCCEHLLRLNDDRIPRCMTYNPTDS